MARFGRAGIGGGKECALSSAMLVKDFPTDGPQVFHTIRSGEWNMLNGFSNALSVALCILFAGWAFYSARTAIAALGSLRRKLASVESQVESLKTSLDDANNALQALANRVKMMRVRNAANHTPTPSGEADPYTDPDRWRQQMNRKLGTGKLPV